MMYEGTQDKDSPSDKVTVDRRQLGAADKPSNTNTSNSLVLQISDERIPVKQFCTAARVFSIVN
eukprot:scaffold4485_cov149-Ochromonas_danica.AAC.1